MMHLLIGLKHLNKFSILIDDDFINTLQYCSQFPSLKELEIGKKFTEGKSLFRRYF